MNYSRIASLALLTLLCSCSPTKKLEKKTDSQTLENLKSHIQYLADDKLEGRRTGSEGEKLAMEYIGNQFKEIGLLPKGPTSYFQSFVVDDGKKIKPGTQLSINGNTLTPETDFFPFPYSPNQSLEALPAVAVQESDMPWFVDLKETLEENKDNPRFDINEYIRTNSKKAKERGASAIFYYNSSGIEDNLKYEPKDKTDDSSIPVIYISKKIAEKYFSDKSATINIKMKTVIGKSTRIGHNVIGYIDNNAASTIVLGAHYDHLGYGEDGGSLDPAKTKSIHNGADDNASGTAALIELARKLKGSNSKKDNYLFIAFSGEELGLFGSKHFTENPTIDLKTVDCMINMDMVGRLNDSSKVVTVGGYGTSPTWGLLFNNVNDPHIFNNRLVFRFDSTGTGPSDHTSFYRKDIPVLFYFTGIHSDYHKPSDDADKINYRGEEAVVDHIFNLVLNLGNREKLVFTKTRETQMSTGSRPGVSLGIMPDYTFSGSGVRADGISEGKAAQKAGLKAGDVIIQLGDLPISSLENYMKALGTFKKGDKTKVKIKRGNETLEVPVEF
ncbi:MAG TPA: M20/M25/M40 family metallo-hydrolase [Chitinophagaceae bacterium]|nr:M20/M25/M40 family metallo-hydrolase [Chitinophagaceae bacterium]